MELRATPWQSMEISRKLGSKRRIHLAVECNSSSSFTVLSGLAIPCVDLALWCLAAFQAVFLLIVLPLWVAPALLNRWVPVNYLSGVETALHVMCSCKISVF